MRNGLFIGLGVLLVVASLIGYGIYWAVFDIKRLPGGEFLTEAVSPDGTYTILTYVANGGATVAYAVRGELIFNDEDGKEKTIYWNDWEKSATIVWVDNDKVEINGRQLNVPQETYDFRNYE